jgi:hypothetical protein
MLERKEKHPQIFSAPVVKQEIINILYAVVAQFPARVRKNSKMKLAT